MRADDRRWLAAGAAQAPNRVAREKLRRGFALGGATGLQRDDEALGRTRQREQRHVRHCEYACKRVRQRHAEATDRVVGEGIDARRRQHGAGQETQVHPFLRIFDA